MAKAIGIGGVFIKYKDPEAMKSWFETALGLTANEYGVLFRFNNLSEHHGYLQLGTFPVKTDYFGEEKQQIMLNFRVDHLSELVKKLTTLGTVICDEMEEFDYGKFIHIQDPEGNRIELWEPMDGAFDGEIQQEMH